MQVIAALEGRLTEHMEAEAKSVRRAVRLSVGVTTEETKRLARSHVASRLGRRAGYLVTSKIYENGPVDTAGLVYSRWKRAAANGMDKRALDVLAAHAFGAQIQAARSEYLYIPNVGGRLRRRERRSFQLQAGKVDIVPFLDRRGNQAFLVFERRRRGQGRLIAFLVKKVDLKANLDLEPIYQDAPRQLTARLIKSMDEPAA